MAQTAVRTGRRQERSAQIRADLLTAAERLLAGKGFESTTIADIASEAGVGFGTFYNYFASKEEIYQELILSGLNLLVEGIDERCARTPDHRDRLRIAAEEAADFAVDHPSLFLLLVTNSRLGPTIHQGVEGLVRCLVRWLKEGFAEGAYQPVDPTLAAKAIIGIFGSVLRPLARERASRQEVRAALIRFVQGAIIGAPDV